MNREDTLRVGDTVYSLDDLIGNLNQVCGTGEFDLVLFQECREIFEQLRALAWNSETLGIVVTNHTRQLV